MTPQTEVLLAVAGQTGAVNGNWYAYLRDDRTHRTVAVSLQAGTATWILQGRNGPNDDPTDIDTGTGDKGIVAAAFHQYRLILSAAAGATLRATMDRPGRQAS